MNKEFLQLLMEKTGFPEEAKAELLKSAGALTAAGQEEALDGAVEFFYENEFSISLTQPLVEEMAGIAGLSPYTVWMLLLIEASQRAREAFRQKSVPENIFWDTFSDLRCKALECKEIYDVWGTFVAFWYPIFYSGDLVKLGRLEYENTVYSRDEPYTVGGFTVKKGDKVKNVHIPSSGEPFDQAARLASYKKAYEFFKDELNGGPLVCVCHSWLLYPEYGKILAPGSNFVSFQQDFHIVEREEAEEFDDAWRLFGRDYHKPLAQLPERTSMQRAFKKYFLGGGKPGEGAGILLFDGEKIIGR